MTCAAAAQANASRATERLLSAARFIKVSVCRVQQISKVRRVATAEAAAEQGDASPDMIKTVPISLNRALGD